MNDLAAQLAQELKTALEAADLGDIAFTAEEQQLRIGTRDETHLVVHWSHPALGSSGCDTAPILAGTRTVAQFVAICLDLVKRRVSPAPAQEPAQA